MGNSKISKMSKVNQEKLKQSLAYIRENRKERKFVEACDLQVILRDYNPDKEKRFNSVVVLPNQCRAQQKICVIANVKHLDECKKLGVACIDMDGIKKFNKQGKPVKNGPVHSTPFWFPRTSINRSLHKSE